MISGLLLLVVFGTIFKAIGFGLRKYALKIKELHHTVGAVNFLIAAAIIWITYYFYSGGAWFDGQLSVDFWVKIGISSMIGVLGAWCTYKALEISDLSYLSPYSTLTTALFIIPAFLLLGEVPHLYVWLGMAIIIGGAWIIEKGKVQLTQEEQAHHDVNRKGLIYFSAGIILYSITPAFEKAAILESEPLFVSFLLHLFIGLGFLFLVFIRKEYIYIVKYKGKISFKHFTWAVILSGTVTAIANGSGHIALTTLSVAAVIALKRTVPIYSFIIGYLFFKERTQIRRRLSATAIMIIGSVLIALGEVSKIL